QRNPIGRDVADVSREPAGLRRRLGNRHMARHSTWMRYAGGAAVLAICLAGTGCMTCRLSPELCASDIPRELNMVSLPEYVIEPPDILLMASIRVVPLPPYHIQPLDTLVIQVTGALASEPISGLFAVDPDGTVNLGLAYGAPRVVGLTLEQAKKAITEHLKD